VSKFVFVAAERVNHAVATLCRIIGASVSGFYAWLRAIPTVRTRAEAEDGLRGHIGRIFALAGGPTARRGSTPSCAGKAGTTPAGAWRG
jgi:hypothetical protein